MRITSVRKTTVRFVLFVVLSFIAIPNKVENVNLVWPKNKKHKKLSLKFSKHRIYLFAIYRLSLVAKIHAGFFEFCLYLYISPGSAYLFFQSSN